MSELSIKLFPTHEAHLDVFDFNERGQHIYRKLGYQEFKCVQHGEHPLLIFEKCF